MKIFLKRDKSDENSRYIVYDDKGNELYRIIGKRKASVERTYIMKEQTCIAKIRDADLGMLRTCHVTAQPQSFHIVLSTSRSRLSVTYHGVSFHIRGDALLKSYDIMDIDNTVVACVARRFNSSTQALEINIYDKKYELSCIASAVCFDRLSTTDCMALQAT